jgi:hypothetical protein
VELLPCAIPYRYKLTLEDTGRLDGPSVKAVTFGHVRDIYRKRYVGTGEPPGLHRSLERLAGRDGGLSRCCRAKPGLTQIVILGFLRRSSSDICPSLFPVARSESPLERKRPHPLVRPT